jgi:hypothetical protein
VALDYGGGADEALRAAVEELEERNRQLAADNKRLHVEAVSARGRLLCVWLAKVCRTRFRVSLRLLPAARVGCAGCVPRLGCGGGGSLRRRCVSRPGVPPPCAVPLQATAQEELRDATEQMIVAQAQRDRLRQRMEALDPAAAAEAVAQAAVLGGGEGAGGGDVIQGQLQRISELQREVKRLKQVSK